jgi:hypothetical protein
VEIYPTLNDNYHANFNVYLDAITSISINAPFGKPTTAKATRAGYGSL